MQSELKMCPFCSEQCATLVIDQGDKWAHYEPSCLEVRTGYDLSDDAAWRAEAIAAWNARASDAEITRLTEALEAENERLRKLTCATWFYMPDDGDHCCFSPHEVIDEMYDPEPGNHVFEVACATSLPSIWCAVRVTDDPDTDERFTFTEHATEAEARAELERTA